jgi:hypothetical protein
MACHHAWVHADGWILTAKMTLFVTLGFVRFASESRPAHLRVTLTVSAPSEAWRFLQGESPC